VHAGIKPNVPLKAQDEDDLIWIRKGFLDHLNPHPWLVIHGHTALDAPEHFTNRVDLDSGAGYGRPP
jgi:serine/threonine protein phosphatase 1